MTRNTIKGITRSTAKTLEEYISLYEAKQHEKVVLPKGFTMYYLPDRGFAEYKVDTEGKALYIYMLCGDAKFWRDLGELKCLELGLTCISTICTRNIYAYIRFWKWNVEKEITNAQGHKRFYCKDEQGRPIIITIRNFNEEGEPCYWVTQYISKQREMNDNNV